MALTIGKVTALLAIFVGAVYGYGKCGFVQVTTGSFPPCSFCPQPTCTNTEVATFPWSCQSVSLQTFTVAAINTCQSFGPCDPLSCASVFETWTQPTPTTVTTTQSLKAGACFTTWVTQVTESPCSLTCPTPWCVDLTTARANCQCNTQIVSTATQLCPTNCKNVPCPFSTTDVSYTSCAPPVTTGIID